MTLLLRVAFYSVAAYIGTVSAGTGDWDASSDIVTNEQYTDFGFRGVVVDSINRTAVLRCYFEWPVPSYFNSVQWFKKDPSYGIYLDIKNEGRYNITKTDRSTTLTIDKCGVDCTGVYMCRHEAKDATIRVVMYPTINTAEHLKYRFEGDLLAMACLASGSPSPSAISWLKDGKPLRFDPYRMDMLPIGNLNNATIKIYDLTTADQGRYSCVAHSMNVTNSMDIYVRVKERYTYPSGRISPVGDGRSASSTRLTSSESPSRGAYPH